MGGGAGGALLEAATRGDAGAVASALSVEPRALALTDEVGRTALQRAAAEGHVAVVQLLLQQGADPNSQDHVYGNTAAHEAAWKGYSCCVRLLSRAGADLRLLNGAGFTPLHFACQNGHNQSCREALLAGASPDLHNTYGDTPLHTAARYGHAGVTRILLSAQCKVSEQNRNGDTALHIAAAMGRRKLTRILLEAGCDKSVRNLQAETARDIATRKSLHEIVHILNTPIAKQSKKKRDKSKDRVLDETDSKKRDRSKDKKKKNVHFENPPEVQWSPYGCHYYPDPKSFPKPRLSSLPTEPLRKGEQYYLDLAGNIKKGPIGAGYTCYCAPFFKHMEEKLNEDKKDLKRHIDRAHERLDQKVTDLEMKTQGQISELTRFVAAERTHCKERHKHLEHWLTRGVIFRASERVKKLDFSPKGSLDIPPLKRTRSLEVLDTEEWNRVHRIIKTFNENCEQYDSHSKDLNDGKATSKSTEGLDRRSPSPRRRHMRSSKSSDQLDAGPSRRPRSPRRAASPDAEGHMQNVTAEIHVKSNRVSVSQSPVSMELRGYNQRYASPGRQVAATSPARPSEPDDIQREPGPSWKSQVLQRTADDIRKRVEIEKEMSEVIARNTSKTLDISQDGYVKIRKHQVEEGTEREPRRSVQELVAQVEQQRCRSPEPPPAPAPATRPAPPTDPEPPIVPAPPLPSILKMPQQPLRPAPVLKEKPPKSKRFSLHNLIPFPTRKTFQPPPKDDGNRSESSDEEDNPIRSTTQPSPARNANLLQTLPLPNYEAMSNKSPSPGFLDRRPAVPKDAYFHEIPNRQMPYRELVDNGLPYCASVGLHPYERAGLPAGQVQARSRRPLYPPPGEFDAMMEQHAARELAGGPRCYSERLDQNTEVEISNQNDQYRGMYYDNLAPACGPGLLHSRLHSLAINTHLTETQSQTDRESHNDSGYSTKVYGSSQGPSPSLSGHLDEPVPRGLPRGNLPGLLGATSLV